MELSDKAFWLCVKMTSKCWLWEKGKTSAGYGSFTSNYKRYYAHRFSYQITKGHIPEGMNVLHRCDNPSCVRPSHLFLGTHADNVKDKISKGRMPRGSECSYAKITEKDVAEIRKRYSLGESQIDLAAIYGMTDGSISMIVRGKRWKHVSGEFKGKRTRHKRQRV